MNKIIRLRFITIKSILEVKEMNPRFTFKEVRDKFIQIEKKYNVFSLKDDEVYYWKLIRFELFDCIIRSLDIIKEGHPLNKTDKVKRLVLLLKYSFLNIFRKKNIIESDVLFLTHGRKQRCGNKFIDIYLNDIIESFKKDPKEMLIIDRPDHYGRHYYTGYENMVYFERFGHIIREGAYKIFSFHNKLLESNQEILDIGHELYRIFDITLDLSGLVRKRIFRFRFEKKYFDKLLDDVNPQKIFLVASYGKEELIASAQEREIDVIEVQHGVISKYHMGYYFPFSIPIPYFPSKIILFGEFWKQSSVFPKNNTQVVRNLRFMKKMDDNDYSNSKSEKVMFISQGSIGNKLSKVASSFANNNCIDCYFKLHPSEYSNWKLKYSELAECEKKGQIKVIANEKSIYELFNVCNYSIGVYSTAIYESLMYGCKTYLINIEGYQYMEYLIENNYVKLLSQEFTLIDLVNFKNKKILNKSYFYT